MHDFHLILYVFQLLLSFGLVVLESLPFLLLKLELHGQDIGRRVSDIFVYISKRRNLISVTILYANHFERVIIDLALVVF